VGALIAVVGASGVAAGLTMIGQGKGGAVDVSAQAPRTRSSAAGAGATGAAATGAAPASDTSPTSATAVGVAAPATTRPSGSAPTPAAGRRPPATTVTTRPSATTPTSPAPAVASPAAAGTYRYRQSSTLAGTPGEGTLVVAPASASGIQTWTRVVGGTVAASATVMLFNSTGAYMVTPGGSVGAAAACSFATPVPWPPWPTTIGRTTSGHGVCTGGITSYDITTRVQGSAAMTLDGRSVDTMVVVNTIVIAGTANGSPLHATLTETDFDAATIRVPLEVKTHLTGTVIGLSVTTDRTDILESATPS
jgi:hypothetical protein